MSDYERLRFQYWNMSKQRRFNKIYLCFEYSKNPKLNHLKSDFIELSINNLCKLIVPVYEYIFNKYYLDSIYNGVDCRIVA